MMINRIHCLISFCKATHTIVLRTGDGGSTLAAADTITDFADGTDVLGMDDGLQYTDLTIAQGSGDNANDTIIKAGSEYLAVLEGLVQAHFQKLISHLWI